MGCDISSFIEVKRDGEWTFVERGPWGSDERNYVWFGFLAGVRNLNIPPISAPRGFPSDSSRDVFDWDCHSHSWLTVEELVHYDYTRMVPSPYEVDSNEPIRDVLGEMFFEILDYLVLNPCFAGELSDVRVVFAFDN